MKIYNIVFSPTGGTQRVADIITNEMNGDVVMLDISSADFAGSSLETDSIAVIAMPSFGGRAPRTAIERLKMVRGNGAKTVIVAVYGNREQEDTLIEMTDTAQECGLQVIAGITAIAEHSIAHQYATGRPDAVDEEQLRAFAKQIIAKLETVSNTTPNISGNRPYKKSGAGLVPKASSACIKCGLCASKCPVGAIDKSNPKNTDKTTCINCMRCVAICPHHARTVNAMMMKAVGVALKKTCSERKENKLFI